MTETKPCTEGRDHRFSCCAEHGTHKAEPYGEHGWNCPTSWAERGLITMQWARYSGKSAALGRTLGMDAALRAREDDHVKAQMRDLMVQCPECEEQIAVPVSVEVQGQDLLITPDTADVWAHAWTHTEQE